MFFLQRRRFSTAQGETIPGISPADFNTLGTWLSVPWAYDNGEMTTVTVGSDEVATSINQRAGFVNGSYVNAATGSSPAVVKTPSNQTSLIFKNAVLYRLADTVTQGIFNSASGYTACYLVQRADGVPFDTTRFLYNANGATQVYHAVTNLNRRYMQYRNAANGVVVVSGAPSNEIGDDRPYWLVFRVERDGANITVTHWNSMVEATKIVSTSSAGMITMSGTNFYLGANSAVGGFSLGGHLMDFQLYNEALPEEALLSLYQYMITEYSIT